MRPVLPGRTRGLRRRAQALPPRRACLALAAALLLAAAGCRRGGGFPPGYVTVTSRLIAEDPAERFDPAGLVASETRFRWSFDGPRALASWTVEGELEDATASPGGLHLRSSQGGAVLTRQVDLAAADVDAVELVVQGLRRGGVAVQWAGPGEDFAPERRAEVGMGARREGPGLDYRLRLLGRPGWQGRIERLRFHLELPRETDVELLEIRGLAEAVAPEGLAAALAHPVKVDLDGDERNALLAPPDRLLDFPLAAPEGTALDLAYGVQKGMAGGVDFRVSLVAAGEARPLFSDRVEAGEQGSWRHARIELPPPAAGETRTLRLETVTAGPFDPRLGFPLWGHPEVLAPPSPAVRRRGPPLNLVLISIDTLRADHLSLYGYQRPTSPQLDAWARQRAAVFETAVAQAPWTLPAHVSLLTGLDAHHHGVNYASPAPASLTFLAEVLRQAGYETAAITGGGYVHPQWGFAQGFDRFHYFGDQMGFENELRTGIERARAFLAAAADRPFFLFFHTYEIHNPYRPRQPWFGRFSRLDPKIHLRLDRPDPRAEDGFLDRRSFSVVRRGKVLASGDLPPEYASLPVDGYDAEVAYTDHHLAGLLRALDALSLAGRTVVVVTSDHGEMLGEHGLYNHLYLYDENLLVPLVIADPRGRGAKRRIPNQVRQVDVMPTVLDLLGLPPPAGVDGVSLVPLMEGRAKAAPPREAWSYAPGSNYGISLRLAGRIHYIRRNDPWPAAGPAEELLAVGRRKEGGPGGEAAAPGGGRAARELTERALAEVPGLGVRLANAGPGVLAGSLQGPMISPATVKTAALACACLSWDGSGRARFRLAPGKVHDLWMEDVRGGKLMVEVAMEGRGGRVKERSAAIDVATLQASQALVFDAGSWRRESPPAAQVATGVVVAWRGEPDLRPEAAPDGDEALHRQLEALGYVH
jgi:arylsulfatase A-like enzyme